MYKVNVTWFDFCEMTDEIEPSVTVHRYFFKKRAQRKEHELETRITRYFQQLRIGCQQPEEKEALTTIIGYEPTFGMHVQTISCRTNKPVYI